MTLIWAVSFVLWLAPALVALVGMVCLRRSSAEFRYGDPKYTLRLVGLSLLPVVNIAVAAVMPLLMVSYLEDEA